jgi:hypothetical protein
VDPEPSFLVALQLIRFGFRGVPGGIAQHLDQSRVKPLDLLLGESRHGTEWRETSQVENFIRVGVADAPDDALLGQHLLEVAS